MRGLKQIVAGVLVMGLLAGCSTPKEANQAQNSQTNTKKEASTTSKQVTLNIFAKADAATSSNYADMQFFKELEEKTNIHINWEVLKEGYEQKLNLKLASGTIPDALYHGPNALKKEDINKFGASGFLVPLENLVEENATNLKSILDAKPNEKKALFAVDKHMYALPIFNELGFTQYDAVYINKKWLDELGLAVPTTTEEFYQVLKAFKEKDANGNGDSNDEIPMSFAYGQGKETQDILSMFGAFGRTDTENHIVFEGEKAVFTADKDEYKAGIEYFAKLYKEQLLDIECFTQDYQVYRSKIKNGNIGVWIDWRKVNMYDEVEKDYIALQPLKGVDNKVPKWNKRITGFIDQGFEITKANKHQVETMKWIDEHYNQDTSFVVKYGPVGINQIINDNGKYEQLPMPEGMSLDEWQKNAPGSGGVYALTADAYKNKYEFTGKVGAGHLEKLAVCELYQPFLTETPVNLSLQFTKEQSDQLQFLRSDIVNYVNEMKSKWIVNGGIDESWDEYKETLEKMGLEEYKNIYQNAYTNFLK